MAATLCMAASFAWADTEDHQKRQRVLEGKIASLIKELEGEKNRYSDLERKLADVERRIQFQNRTLRSLEIKTASVRERLQRLEIQREDQQQELRRQQGLLSQQVRAAWMTGNQERLQLWLNGGDVKLFGPVLTWYEYVNKSRSENVIGLSDDVARLKQTEQELREASVALERLRDTEQKSINQLGVAREQREALLTASKARIAAEESQLQKLKKEQAELAALIKRLKELAARAPKKNAQKPSQPFAKLTGQLRWPVKGKIVHDYGAPRANGRLKWNGVTIQAKQGAKVRAIAGGEVIFADWLGRLGLLMIVDHGGDYLTLYGHNQALYKKPGETVSPGELIASVGDSGGRTESALYFEVRKGSSFRNPHQWCKKAAL